MNRNIILTPKTLHLILELVRHLEGTEQKCVWRILRVSHTFLQMNSRLCFEKYSFMSKETARDLSPVLFSLDDLHQL